MRLHLFEWEDLAWFPDKIRNFMTDFLSFVGNRLSLFDNCLPVLRQGLERSGILIPSQSRTIQNQRFIFLESYLGGVLSARETRLGDTSRAHATWSDASTLAHFAATVTWMLEME